MGQNYFDVVIIGGGIAGCTTALSLARSAPEASFLLLDNANPTQYKIGESLPAEAKRYLEYLSPTISERLVRDTASGVHTTCTGNASVWNSPSLRETFAIMNPFGKGWHLDRAAFDESLREQVRSVCREAAGRSELLNGAFTSVQKEGSEWKVTLRSDSDEPLVFRSKWLIDASGRKASVAQKLGAKTVKLDGLLAFYTVFSSTDVDHDRRTVVEATETGWWYTSQLSNQTRVVAFHTDDCDPSAKVARRIDGFLDMLHADTKHISQTITSIDYRPMSSTGTSYPRCTAAGSSFLSPYNDQEARWCAVGDAAIAFDPLSSQGMITALRMGCSVGIMLAGQLSPPDESKETIKIQDIRDVYDETRNDYDTKKRHHYSQSMFQGEFWQRRRQ